MAIPKVGDFYINNANQDFYLRELVGGIPTWVRKGNIRDDGTSGLLSVAPNVALGFNLSVQVDRIRFLGSIAFDYGFTQINNVDRLRQLAAAFNLGFNETATVGAMVALAAQYNLGFNETVALFRTQQISEAHALGFSLAAALTHSVVAPAGFVVMGLSASPWSLWYDGALTLQTPGWTVPTTEVIAVEFSPDRSKLVVATTANGIFRYDMSSGTPVYMGALSGAPAWAHIAAIGWSGDGTRFAVLDGQLSPFCWVYDTSTWTTVTAPAPGANATQIVFNGTANSKIAIGTNQTPSTVLFDTPGMATSATQLGSRPTNTTLAMDFTADGAYFASIANGTPAQFKVWQMSAPSAPLADPASMPHANGGAGARSMRFSHGGTKLVVCDGFGTYCYNISGTTITQDQTINFNVIGGVSPAWKADDTKLYLAQSSAPRFQVYSRVGGVYTADANPASQPASSIRCIASSI